MPENPVARDRFHSFPLRLQYDDRPDVCPAGKSWAGRPENLEGGGWGTLEDHALAECSGNGRRGEETRSRTIVGCCTVMQRNVKQFREDGGAYRYRRSRDARC